MDAVQNFRESKGRRVTFEYTMIQGVNDDESMADELARLAKQVQAFVNLIPFNPIPYQDWVSSSAASSERSRPAREGSAA